MRILIVKTSSLGDIIQTFNILDYLKQRFPECEIDWAVEENLVSLAAAHPQVRRAIALDLKGMKKGWKKLSYWKSFFRSIQDLRRDDYDLLFDLQGNCKSGLITSFSRARAKVGFGFHSVREKPNLLATHIRFDIPRNLNIRSQHLRLIQEFFLDKETIETRGVRFKISEEEKGRIQNILKPLPSSLRVMVCPGSKWANKQLPLETLSQLLGKIEQELQATFLLVWGTEAEKEFCEQIQAKTPSVIIEKLPLTTWQNLMNEVDLVIAVDSSALHLCGTTRTPSFSLFGPTNPEVFKPIGHAHLAVQGKCPYGRVFEKTCPVLRTCPTGACIRDLDAEELFQSFLKWWKAL